jgi:hypothetical protein
MARQRRRRQRVADNRAPSGKDLPVEHAGGAHGRDVTRFRTAGTVVA